MIDCVIVFDDQDTELGDFFKFCSECIKSNFQSASYSLYEFDSSKLQSINLTKQIPFVFLALSHGTEDSLIDSRDVPYLDILNLYKYQFQDTFFYAFACQLGKKLGKEIIRNGGKCFVGHDNDVWGCNDEPWKSMFSDPVKVFAANLAKGDSILVCIEKTKYKYDVLLDNAFRGGDLDTYMRLMDNLNSLVVYGDDTCTINDFAY
jgi:hypothetical protein